LHQSPFPHTSHAGRRVAPDRLNRVDFGLAKVFAITGRMKLHIRAEAFNAFNAVSFTALNTTVRFDANGNPTGGFGAVTAAAPGRVMEFGVRLTF
jgi:hypothetical protein